MCASTVLGFVEDAESISLASSCYAIKHVEKRRKNNPRQNVGNLVNCTSVLIGKEENTFSLEYSRLGWVV